MDYVSFFGFNSPFGSETRAYKIKYCISKSFESLRITYEY